MNQQSLVRTARLAGASYLVLALSGLFGFMIYHPQLFIADDPARTLSNLTAMASTARIRLLLELVIIVSQALAAVYFYRLFRGIDGWAAAVLGLWGTVNALIITISAVAMGAAIEVAQSAATELPQKIASIQLLTGIITQSWSIGGLFFGLWLIPMGSIVIRSRRMPLWLGRFLVFGGFGYLVQTFLMAAGMQSPYIGMVVMPATIGELWMVGYLLAYGIRPDAAEQR